MRKNLSFDWILVSAIVLLMSISLLELYSISFSGANNTQYVWRQMVFVGIGLVVMFFLASMDYRVIRPYHARIVYFGTLTALGLVLAIGTNVRGTVGWIVIGPVSLQIVEFAKIAMIVFLASFIAAKQTVFGPGGRLLVSLMLIAIVIGLVLAQPDFGSAMILLSLWFGMLFVSGMRRLHIILIVVVMMLMGVGTWFMLADYQRDRVLAFVNPYNDPRGSGYNVIQAMIATGSGGITGKGLGHGTQAQLGFLPEPHTDFIFAVIAEEFGFFGAIFVIGLMGVIIVRLWRIALRARTNFSYLVVVGTMIMFFVQVLINVGMNIGIMPVTGIPLPFVSYGGSSLLASSIAIGLVLSIDRISSRMKDFT